MRGEGWWKEVGECCQWKDQPRSRCGRGGKERRRMMGPSETGQVVAQSDYEGGKEQNGMFFRGGRRGGGRCFF